MDAAVARADERPTGREVHARGRSVVRSEAEGHRRGWGFEGVHRAVWDL